MLSRLKAVIKLKGFGACVPTPRSPQSTQPKSNDSTSDASGGLECLGKEKQQQQGLPAKPGHTSPHCAANAKQHAAQQALQPDHACQLLSRTSSTDSCSMANALQPASKSCSSVQPLSSKGSSFKSMASLRHAHTCTLAPSSSKDKLNHQSLDCSDSRNTSANGHSAAVPATEHARKGLQPLAHESSSPAELQSNLLSVLGIQSGTSRQSTPPKSQAQSSPQLPLLQARPEPAAPSAAKSFTSMPSANNNRQAAQAALFPWGGGEASPARLGSSVHNEAGRPSFSKSSGRLGKTNFEGSPRSRPNNGSEHRLGSLDLGPLCHSLALQDNKGGLHAAGRARVLRDRRQCQHQHQHQHKPSGRVSVDQLREPVSAAFQIMARSSMEQHSSMQECTTQKLGRLLPRAPPPCTGSSPTGESLREGLSVEGPQSSPSDLPRP